MKTFCIGDIHGGYQALLQCLERSKFDKEKDTLIVLGDVCDGWSEVKECIEELLTINCIFIIGNHDFWALSWMNTGHTPMEWISQGGQHTMESYGKDPRNVPIEHRQFLRTGLVCYMDEKKRMFVHGGFDPNKSLSAIEADVTTAMWDRDLLTNAVKKNNQRPNYKYGRNAGCEEIYVGHTSLTFFGKKVPTKFCNVWGMDTGGGWEGKLSIMDIDTHEYWQSDIVSKLYPNDVPR